MFTFEPHLFPLSLPLAKTLQREAYRRLSAILKIFCKLSPKSHSTSQRGRCSSRRGEPIWILGILYKHFDCIFWFESKQGITWANREHFFSFTNTNSDVFQSAGNHDHLCLYFVDEKKRRNKESSSGEGYQIKIPQWIQRSDEWMSNMFPILFCLFVVKHVSKHTGDERGSMLEKSRWPDRGVGFLHVGRVCLRSGRR